MINKYFLITAALFSNHLPYRVGDRRPESTVKSAIWATKEALYGLGHPLAPTHRSIEAERARIKEREFYAAFLGSLEKSLKRRHKPDF